MNTMTIQGHDFTYGARPDVRFGCLSCKAKFFPYLAGTPAGQRQTFVGEVFSTCPRCGARAADWGWGEIVGLRVKVTSGACGEDCRTATGTDCKCSCGGANHGTL